ncbi:haloacid dehalogenase-like hydrolase [Kutzneria viridogrisea]|uniref:Haloacid dehalogenase domain protein hydrolase n=2 Tax=Kutzneria TaxID=43356 RepID=W5W241_9PSEU|nr:haloacid dehalogenase-like hydrolase [Kutzneria albida]AHH94927.1 Haloacid dehalogenase domain protein hydrolase [Kutzneria albida DSM 43870]MBA8927741.1 phosphoglycolate phosphatase-like HAD superfamily hydrolase [Kutzneria viridogrisea]
MRLVLWDIDMTLVVLPGVGLDWYGRAMANTVGAELLHRPALGGRTDLAIATELLTAHGVEASEEVVGALFAEVTVIAGAEAHTVAERGHVLPGAREALAALAGTPRVVQTLVTGNLAALAGHKLTPFGLDTHLDLGIGGYGELSAHRPDLVAAAVRKAEAKHGCRFAPDSVVVIGDTPHDVDAALQNGAVAVGVATGGASEQDLREAGAHHTLRDLSNTAQVLAAVL